MPNTRYISQLYEVEFQKKRDIPGVFSALLTTVLLTAALMWLYVRLHNSLMGVLLFVLVAPFLLYAIASVLIEPFIELRYVKTSPEGILVRSWLRRRFVDWSDVVDAKDYDSDEDRWLMLRMRRGKIYLPPEPTLEASVWQHLQRYGRGEKIELSEEARSFWCELPGDIPEETLWCPGEHQRRAKGVSSVEVSRNGVNVRTAQGTKGLAWSDVTEVEWEYDIDPTPFVLKISGSALLTSIHIPVYPDDRDGVTLLLAVIRHVRKLEGVRPLYVPEGLGSFDNPGTR